RGEDEVTRLTDGERRLDGLEIAELAEQYHVGILAQHVLQRLRVARAVGADLALVHDGELVRVQKLDRIFDRDDVVALLAVDLVDERRERRRLARARRPGDEHEAPWLVRERLDHRGEGQLVEAPDLEG